MSNLEACLCFGLVQVSATNMHVVPVPLDEAVSRLIKDSSIISDGRSAISLMIAKKSEDEYDWPTESHCTDINMKTGSIYQK